MSERHKFLIGLTTGDLNGIGIEIILKTFADNRMMEFCTPVLYGSSKAVSYYRKIMGMQQFVFAQSRSVDRIQSNTLNIINCWEDETNIQPGLSTETGGRYALLSLRAAVDDLKAGRIDGLVTAPINKKNIQSDQFPFAGHTGFLAHEAGVSEYCMLLCSSEMRVGLVTGHIPVSAVAAEISRELILKKLSVIRKSLVQDFGIDKPRIAVLGLNPHAGDEGVMGSEEAELIRPAVKEASDKGIFCFGPYAADGFFGSSRQTKFDAVLAMYHDQGLIPFKTLYFESGVNYTAGLPWVRTSPDHGVGYDIAGKNTASEESFRAAVFAATDILQQRRRYAEMTAHPIKKGELTKEG